jgi:hypothetical protein
MAKKGEWPKSYVIPSVILTLACGGLLYWHLKDPTRKVDAWAVTLLVVGFLPWLRTVFENRQSFRNQGDGSRCTAARATLKRVAV